LDQALVRGAHGAQEEWLIVSVKFITPAGLISPLAASVAGRLSCRLSFSGILHADPPLSECR
jgi:hypothetical protein